jgi:hypothetical protein
MAKEGEESLQAQLRLAPETYQSRSQYDPLYTDLQVSNMQRSLLGQPNQGGLLSTLEQVAPRLQALTDTAQNRQRTSDVEALQRLGPQAVEAIRASDPRQAALLDQLNTAARQGLESGAGVDPSLAGTIGQSVRSRSAALGFGFGQPDAVSEAYALGDRGQALRQQRQQFGTQVAGLNYATGADPAMAILGRPSSAAGGAQALLQQGQGAAARNGAGIDPWGGYSQDLFNTNYNAEAASRIASGNATAGIIGSGLSAL